MIPFISNVGFTTVSSSGTLNDKAGTSKSKLPVQIFRLTDNISGNLTMSNDSAHKKIILDTNGNNILNSSGSPITNNSSTALEIIGSGNVQSTLKTFTATQASNSYTGTTTPSNSDSSTVIVDDDHTYNATGQSVTFTTWVTVDGSGTETSYSFAGSNEPYFMPKVPSGTTIVVSSSSVTAGTLLTLAQSSTVFGSAGANASGIAGSWKINGSTGNGSFSGQSVSGGVVGGTTNTGFGNPNCLGVRFIVSSGVFTRQDGTAPYDGGGDGEPESCGTFSWSNAADTEASSRISSATASGMTVVTTGRRIRFTNNLAIAVAITGDDNPFGSVSVSAGATQTANRDSTDGSFDIVGTVSGNDGSSQPYALAPVNNGTGSIVTSGLTGTLSASAL